MKLRISYKREGDGFQCDAICDLGYTFLFYFCHGELPNLNEKIKHFDLSPTARRVVWLAERLPNKWTRIFMDNLFNLQKLFSALYLAQVLAHGATPQLRCVSRSVCSVGVRHKAGAHPLNGSGMR